MDLSSNNQTQSSSSLEDDTNNTMVDPTTQFMNLMDDKAFHSSLDSEVLDEQQPSENKQRPQLMKWITQEGHIGDSISIILKQASQHPLLHPIKLVFNNQILETEEERRKDNENDVLITLVAKVPSLEEQQEGDNVIQVPLAICMYDPANQRAVDHWPIGMFTYHPHQGNKRAADEASLYHLDTSTYAKKPHTSPSDYMGPSSDFDQGDFMKLLSPYDNNVTREPVSPTSANSTMGRLPSPAAQQRQQQQQQQQQQGLPKAVSLPDMRKPSIEEPHASYTAMFQGNIPPSPNSLGMQGTQQQRPQEQQRHTDHPSNFNNYSSNVPQIMPRVSPTSSYPSQYNNYGSNAGYGNMGYPAYQDNTMATNYIQQPQSNNGPATAPAIYDSSSHYFSSGQAPYNNSNSNNYDSSYMDQSNIMAAPPLTPPLQQKRLSQIHQGGLLPPSSHQYTPIKSSKRPSINHSTDMQPPFHHPFAGLVSRPQLNIHNDLMDATRNWTQAEWAMRRRILKFWRQPNAQQIDCGFEILDEEVYRSQRIQQQQQQQQQHGDGDTSPTTTSSSSSSTYNNSKDNLVVSCIYWQERNDYYITSVDCIQLIEGLIGVEFTVEEKNRIRRNLEALRPLTAAKTRPESVEFFKLIMGFPAPKPRNIEKDVKVFQWSTLGPAIKKIIGKYTPSYSSTASVVNYNPTTSHSDISSFAPPLPPPPPPPPQQQHYHHFDTPRLSRS